MKQKLLIFIAMLWAAASYGQAGKILFTEFAVLPTAGEFIEIYNPGSSVIDLSDYYITDATFASGGVYYYNIVLGTNYGGGDFGKFHARFPDGATINPGEIQTISLAGSDSFSSTYAIDCTYELFEDGVSLDDIPDMREAVAGSISNQGGLTNSGEVCILYAWDGSSDLVTDIDYFIWVDTDEGVDKTGVTINTSTYNDDTPLVNQEFMTPTHPEGESWQRIDLTEGSQTTSGGNGVAGRDETSENITVTWESDIPGPFTVASVNINKINPTNKITIYPNPSNFVFNVSLKEMFILEIIDITGRVIYTKTLLGDSTIEINTNGVYFFKFSNENESIIKRVIVQ